MPHHLSFTATLFRHAAPGGRHFAAVPAAKAPSTRLGWGRSPVHATVDGVTWDTSVWWDSKSERTLLAVPKKIRGSTGDGDRVKVTLEFEVG